MNFVKNMHNIFKTQQLALDGREKTMQITAFNFKLPANAPEDRKAISYHQPGGSCVATTCACCPWAATSSTPPAASWRPRTSWSRSCGHGPALTPPPIPPLSSRSCRIPHHGGLPNVLLTPHLASSKDRGCRRLGSFAIEKFECLRRGKPSVGEILRESLVVIA